MAFSKASAACLSVRLAIATARRLEPLNLWIDRTFSAATLDEFPDGPAAPRSLGVQPRRWNVS